ncbi:MAG: septum formation protein Maf [Clostridia bacterium]|nr:septum formation protein Maf [Clostridia bacterium]
MTKLYLASLSPRRKEILEEMRLPFTVLSAEADEQVPAGTDPQSAGQMLAVRKAAALRDKLTAQGAYGEETAVLAADTLVYLDDRPLGKPKDAAEALEMLSALSGRTHTVCTGMCLLVGARSYSLADVTKVKMRAFSAEEAAAYVATGEPLDKAGAYGIQGLGALLVQEIEGDYFSVMGLSKCGVYRLFQTAGLPYWSMIRKEKHANEI